jgi:hypothetical protein
LQNQSVLVLMLAEALLLQLLCKLRVFRHNVSQQGCKTTRLTRHTTGPLLLLLLLQGRSPLGRLLAACAWLYLPTWLLLLLLCWPGNMAAAASPCAWACRAAAATSPCCWCPAAHLRGRS